ncbi:hypothetical protein BEWA_005620 [Theileria equi strain WA]|uniref:Uncharacterized protein n=1 Tax=Theileria equi strain WA TaxID=1537102 RepID=L0B1Z5_THEEQ|nr:hypothetical protein BEWA_005620 [Theileria equi strain WA]AFZ81154.1 hypothetical protein BEWA_005620 [Theileria equi strain WA]|eukprot:XP_004830820.1 hypothetical protein BEWA_005620 [Theileria equi strain WA]
MIVRHEHRKRSNGESQLFPRLVSVLKGSDVTLRLLNGTHVTGTIGSYGKEIKTANILSSLVELAAVEPSCKDFETILSGNVTLGNVYKAFKPPDTSERIYPLPGSSLILKETFVEYNGKRINASLVSVRESHIATLSPASRGPNEEGALRKGIRCNIKEMILQQHRDHIKNQAFTKCNHIGSNNTRN